MQQLERRSADVLPIGMGVIGAAERSRITLPLRYALQSVLREVYEMTEFERLVEMHHILVEFEARLAEVERWIATRVLPPVKERLPARPRGVWPVKL